MKQTPAHNTVNNELLAMIPPRSRRVVEIGCMQGALAGAFRARHPDVHYTGIDIDPDYAAVAAQHCDRAFAADVEKLDDEAFASLFPSDCWVFGDCLEHLRDPWALLRRIRASIDPAGTLVTCIPNAQHWSVQMRLAIGQFRYEDSGLLDRTHIRWFTRITMLEMFHGTGWRVVGGLARHVTQPGEERFLEAVRAMANAAGSDAEAAVRDSSPFQYMFKLQPA